MKNKFAILSAAALAVFVATGAVSGGALAQNQMGAKSSGLSNPANVVKDFSVETVGPVLNELGMAWQVDRLDNGAQFVIASSGSLQYVLFFTACQGAGGTGCIGMQAVMFFTGVEPNPQTVQAFNAKIPFVTVGVDQDGEAFISRYDIADYGIPRGNIASSIMNFLASAEMFAAELAAGHQTVSLDGYASDLAASQLNRRATEALTGVPAHARQTANRFQRHEVGLDEGAEMIRLLLNADGVARNKVDNKFD